MNPPAKWRSVRVGSLNAAKIDAVRAALSAYVEDPLQVDGVAVASGVSEQPVGFAEIARGSRERARAAAASGACDLAVGVEDGLVELPGLPGECVNVGFACVREGERESLGLSSAFAYPPRCAERAAQQREPIGALFDTLWSEYRGTPPPPEPSGRREGNIGKLSLGVLSRSEYARHAVLCALVRHLHPALYFPDAEVAA